MTIRLQMHVSRHGLPVDVGNQNSGPQVCTLCTFSTEPPSQARIYTCIYFVHTKFICTYYKILKQFVFLHCPPLGLGIESTISCVEEKHFIRATSRVSPGILLVCLVGWGFCFFGFFWGIVLQSYQDLPFCVDIFPQRIFFGQHFSPKILIIMCPPLHNKSGDNDGPRFCLKLRVFSFLTYFFLKLGYKTQINV